MARSLDQVMAELDPYYSTSANIYQTKLNALPGEQDAGIAQADAKLAQANDSILAGARRRGLGFSGVPVAEQTKYAATDYAPAIANLKSATKNQELSIMEALSGLKRDQRTQAQSLVDSELAREFQDRQFAEQVRQFNESQAAAERQAAAARAASSVDLSRYLGGNSVQAGGSQKSNGPQVVNNNGSFAFSNGGKPITAAQYAGLVGKDIRDVLYDMGTAGDQQAARAYNILRTLQGSAVNGMLSQLAKQSPHLFGGFTPVAVTKPTTSSSPSTVKPTSNMLLVGKK